MAERVQVGVLYCGQGMTNWIEYFPTDTAWTNKLPTMLVLVDMGGGGSNKEKALDHIVGRLVAIKAANGGTTPSIRCAVISHQDSDHWNLISRFIKRLKPNDIDDLTIDMIWKGGKAWKTRASNAVKKLSDATSSTIAVLPDECTDYEGNEDDLAEEGSCRVRLVIANAPTSDSGGGMEENGTSAVVAVELGSLSCILPGDATYETMDRINAVYGTDDYPPPCFGLSIPHHGALRTSVQGYSEKKKVNQMGWEFVDEFIDLLQAQQVAASAGYQNNHKHPMLEIMKRFEKYCTTKDALHYLQVFNFTDGDWQAPTREKPVWTTSYYVSVPPPPGASKKRGRTDPDLKPQQRHVFYVLKDDGTASVHQVVLHDEPQPMKAPPTAPPPSADELAAHAARTAGAAGSADATG